jgi:signal transduction histidine kinase
LQRPLYYTAIGLVTLMWGLAVLDVISATYPARALVNFKIGLGVLLVVAWPIRRGHPRTASLCITVLYGFNLFVSGGLRDLRAEPQFLLGAIIPLMFVLLLARGAAVVVGVALIGGSIGAALLMPTATIPARSWGGRYLILLAVFLIIAATLWAYRRVVMGMLEELRQQKAATDATNAALTQMIAERDRLEASQRTLQRLEAMGRVAGSIAHDFNNVLMAIRGSAEELPHLTPAEQAAELRALEGMVDGGARLTAQLLLFARQGTETVGTIELRSVLDTMSPMLQRLMSPQHRITCTVEGAPQLVGDRAQWEQVVLNLVVNARDAMPDGGEVRVIAQERTMGGARLTVQDHGVGMTADVQARIFEPFYTTKGPHGGTGLGLATVYGIVQRHAGLIHVDSTLGVGTTFTVDVPPVPQASPAEVAVLAP